MAKQNINVGTAANDKKGDSLRAAFQKVNANFTELYAALGLTDVTLNLGAFTFTGSTMSTDDSTNIVIDKPITVNGEITVDGDITPKTNFGASLGTPTKQFKSLYVSTNTVFLGGVPLSLEAGTNELTINNVPISQTINYADIPNAPKDLSDLTDNSGSLGGGSTLVNGAYTVSLGSNGNLNAPGIVSATGLRTSETKIALGSNAGQTSQGINSVAVGGYAGQTSQGAESVAIGYGAGAATQGFSSVAVGNLAGSNTQGGLAVAVGNSAGQLNQGYEAVAVGFNTGLQDQGTWAVAIGSYAGAFSQGEDAIAIGRFAGQTDQPDNTIILNASGSAVNGVAAQTNSFYVAPIRNIGGTSGVLQYNAATKEVSYSSDITSEGNINIEINLSDSTLRRWQFGEDGALTLPAGGTILNSSGQPYVYGVSSINTSVTTSIFTDASGDYQYGTLSYDYAVNGVSNSFSIEYSRPLVGGNVDINVGNTIVNGDLTLSGDIRSEGNINIDINLSDSTLRRWQFGEDGHLTLPAGGDIKDSTGTSVLGGGSGSSLVNGAYTVSLGSTGTLTVPANGIITAPNAQEFQLQAKAADSVLRNEINLDPNNGTYMSVWSDQTTSFSSADWGSGSWNNESGLGAARFTDAQALQDFWLTGPGSLGLAYEVSINGGARSPNVFYDGNNGETYGVTLGVDPVPPGGPGTTVPITSLVFYYQTESRINIDATGSEILLDAQSMDLDLRTTLNLDLRANQNLNLRGLGTYPVRIYTNGTTHKWEFDNTGSLTLPREGKIYGIGQGSASDRAGYISWDGNSSGDGSGYNTMRLVPDLTGLEDADQYIILDPTGGVPGHIHIRAGGTQDNSGAHLYLGGEHSHVKISAGLNPPVTVMADDNAWIFGTDGAITTSDAFTIKTPNGVPSSVSNWVGGGGWNSPPYTNLATTGGTGTGLTVNVSTAAGGYININAITINTAGTGYTNGDVITINNENNIPGTFTIGVAGTNSWAFGTSGDLTVPGDIKSTANTSIIIDGGVLLANVTVDSVDSFGGGVWRMFITSSAYPTLGTIVQVGDTATTAWGTPVTVTITSIVQDVGAGTWALHTNQNITTGWYSGARRITINSTRVKTWTFGTDKSLTFPDATVQTTAWTGAPATLNVTGAATAERFNTDQITIVGNRLSTTVTNANLELECNGSGGVVINAVADATTASTVKSVGYLGLPQSATATSGTLAISDAGKHIYVTTTGQAIAIPDNSSVAYPIGTTLTFIAGPSATTVLIVINTDTLRLAGSSSTGTRTLAANGMATAVKVASTLWYINGTGLT